MKETIETPASPEMQQSSYSDGGAAFPNQDWQAVGNTHPGMTLRDIADAMLKAREVKP
jgi:hypothetical protein